MTSSGYLYCSGLLFAAAAYNSTLVYVIPWRKVVTVFCVLLVSVTAGLIIGAMP